MAVPAQTGKNQRSPADQKQLTGLQHMVVRLYAEGQTRSVVAATLAPHIYPKLHEQEAKKRLRKKLRTWEETQWFRDAVYDYSMVQTDMDIPRILRGVRSRARRGRVDAARLILEVTGRHNPRGETAQPAVVQINFGGAVPRPTSRQHQPEALDEPIEDAEVVDED